MFLVSSCSCLCPIPWSQGLRREWRCSWSSADRRYSNYIWVIDNCIAYLGASYIRDLTVAWFDNHYTWPPPEIMMTASNFHGHIALFLALQISPSKSQRINIYVSFVKQSSIALMLAFIQRCLGNVRYLSNFVISFAYIATTTCLFRHHELVQSSKDAFFKTRTHWQTRAKRTIIIIIPFFKSCMIRLCDLRVMQSRMKISGESLHEWQIYGYSQQSIKYLSHTSSYWVWNREKTMKTFADTSLRHCYFQCFSGLRNSDIA